MQNLAGDRRGPLTTGGPNRPMPWYKWHKCWNYKQVRPNGRAAMASDSEPIKFFRGPLLEGPNFLQILYNANDGFHRLF